MLRLRCVFGRVGVSDPVAVPLVDGESIRQVFQRESAGEIELTNDSSNLGATLYPALTKIGTYDLHVILSRLTQNQKTAGPVSQIGVIYAGTFKHNSDVLGIMFDRGFRVDGEDDDTDFRSVPREGCAIFVDAIRKIRPIKKQFNAELAFSTMHELGHLFNLEHTNSSNGSVDFMTRSQTGAPYGSESLRFGEPHRRFLRKYAELTCIRPGGTAYGDRSQIGESFDPATSGNVVQRRNRRRSRMHLHINLTRDSFWYFEPVELEVHLRLPPAAPTSERFPDAVDPGYSNFQIWIEEPDGARRRYRSPKFFCAQPRMLSVEPGWEFVRDVSIFGEAGGYTFRQPGVHRLWAIFQAAAGIVLTSNVVTCELRAFAAGTKFQRSADSLRRQSQLLYYRRARLLTHCMEQLREFALAASTDSNVAVLRYALGRAFVSAGERSRGSLRRKRVACAYEQLTRALDSGRLGKHAADRAQEALACLSKLR